MMQTLIDFVIRPPRAEYLPTADLLGPHLSIKRKTYKRHDFKLVNSRGHELMCSHYKPHPLPENVQHPCVIYCHGNSGCRADANEAVIVLLPSNITVFCLDFSGSGLSGGEYVSLGKFEMEDLKTVVAHLREEGKTSQIGLWGRSMGAVTCLLYGATDPSIAGMVLDSPFSKLNDLMMELVDTYKIRIPKFTVRMAVQYMRRAIQKKAGFDIMELDTTEVATRCFIPVLFGHATGDAFILPHHSDDIYKLYAGDKNIIKFEGDHNSQRPNFYYDSITIFYHNVLCPPGIAAPEHKLFGDDVEFDDFDQATLLQLIALQDSDRQSMSTDAGPSSSTGTQDLEGEHSRSGWQMSQSFLPAREEEDVDSDIEQMLREAERERGSRSFDSGEASTSSPQSPSLASSSTGRGMRSDLLEANGHSIPRDMDDEEAMLMAAIALSLKDGQPPEPQPDGSSSSSMPASEDSSSSASEIKPESSDAKPVSSDAKPECNDSNLESGSGKQEEKVRVQPWVYTTTPNGRIL